jgi:hypothetical protein
MVQEVIRVTISARGFVVKHVDTAEVRIVVAAVLATAADAVLVAHHLPELGAHLRLGLLVPGALVGTAVEGREQGGGARAGGVPLGPRLRPVEEIA